MLAIATLLTHKIYIAIATIYTHITYCRPHHLDGHSSKISQMSLQVDTINILATGVDCVPKSENAGKNWREFMNTPTCVFDEIFENTVLEVFTENNTNRQIFSTRK